MSEYDAILAAMTPDERAQFETLCGLNDAPPLWQPDPQNKPQQMAFESEADVIGFGGAAGGGKSDFAIGIGLMRHETVQFFRREGTELTGIIDRVAQIVGNRKGLGGRPPVWRNPSPTCKLIEFGSVPHLGDEAAYQGRPKDLLVCDEAANFIESQVRFLMNWVRSTNPNQKCRTVLTFNPPTSSEGRWVIAFFAPWLDPLHPNPAKPGELRWFTTIRGKDREVPDNRPFVLVEDADGEEEMVYDITPSTRRESIIRPQSRTFIPSRVTDNSYLRDTDYISRLQAAPEPLRSQMLYGDFAASIEDDPMQVIPTAWVDAAMARWAAKEVLPEMDSVGVDVALKGRDNTVIARRHGMWFDHPIVYPGVKCTDGPTVAGYVIASQRNAAPVHIDLFGVGARPYAHLMTLGVQVIGVNMGDPATGSDSSGKMGFTNIRSMLWWRMREALDPNANNGIALPPDRQLRADLCAPLWKPQGSKIRVEDRRDIIKRLGRSPDWATAYVLALLVSRAPKSPVEPMPGQYHPLTHLQESLHRKRGGLHDPFAPANYRPF